MSVSESQRLALYRAAQAALGEEEGDTLMALTPPSNTDIATRQDVENWQATFRADIARSTAELRASTTKVVVGTGVAPYLAIVGTAFAAFGLLMNILDIT